MKQTKSHKSNLCCLFEQSLILMGSSCQHKKALLLALFAWSHIIHMWDIM